jgi:hypothetical protein
MNSPATLYSGGGRDATAQSLGHVLIYAQMALVTHHVIWFRGNWSGIAAAHYDCNELWLSGNRDVKRDA